MRIAMLVVVPVLLFVSCSSFPADEPTIDRVKPIDVKPSPDPEPDPEPDLKREGKIVAVTADWCGPCQKWKRECLDDLRKAGWEVELLDDGVGPYPTFTVETGGRKKTWSGYSDRSGFIAKLKEVL